MSGTLARGPQPHRPVSGFPGPSGSCPPPAIPLSCSVLPVHLFLRHQPAGGYASHADSPAPESHGGIFLNYSGTDWHRLGSWQSHYKIVLSVILFGPSLGNGGDRSRVGYGELSHDAVSGKPLPPLQCHGTLWSQGRWPFKVVLSWGEGVGPLLSLISHWMWAASVKRRDL